jgi:hypothetical protein
MAVLLRMIPLERSDVPVADGRVEAEEADASSVGAEAADVHREGSASHGG